MKIALQKSPIPKNHAFVIEDLKQSYFDPKWHFHSEYQIFLVLKGQGTRLIGDSVKLFQEGDLVFTGPNLPHLWRSDTENFLDKNKTEAEGVVIYFHDLFLGQDLLQMEEAIKLKQLFQKSARGLAIQGGTAKRLKNRITGLTNLEGFASVLELLHILNSLATTEEYELLASAGYTNSLKEGDTERMSKVQAYALKHFKRKIALSEVAALANMTPTSFSRYFKVHANKTFSEFLSEIRIGHACKLLIESPTAVAQACYDSGFQTLSNFNKQFKATTKRTPRAYKQHYGMQ